MKRFAMIACSAAIAFGGTAAAQEMNLTMAGASPGGLWSLLGVGVDRAVGAAMPGSTVTYQTSGGGIANVSLLDQGRVELGVVTNAELRLATNGEEPFNKQYDNLRALGYLYNWSPMHLVVDADFAEEHGLETFGDIAEAQPPLDIAFNRPGNISSTVAEGMFEAIGVSTEDIEEWGGSVTLTAAQDQADLLRDGRIDALLNADFVGRATLTELAQAVDVVFLPIGEDVLQTVSGQLGVDRADIPAGSYPGQDENIPSVGLGALLVTTSDMDEETAYSITKAMLDNIGEIQAVHAAMEQLTPEFLASATAIPYHEGAQRAIEEAGIETP